MIEIKPPHSYALYKDKHAVFLGGSIDMGVAEDWQARVAGALAGQEVLVLNPRREVWDSSWEQTAANPPFAEQVNWELDALARADTVVFFFQPGTNSPVTMMELGLLAAESPGKCLVCCPEGFWRKGNVDIVCARQGVRQVEDIDGLVEALRARLPSVKPAARASAP